MTRNPADEGVPLALTAIWARNLPVIRERLEILERAAEALGRGEQVDDAEAVLAAAHKLAGSLGSFGLARGSELAGELERRFDPGSQPGDPTQLTRLVAELRDVIEG